MKSDMFYPNVSEVLNDNSRIRSTLVCGDDSTYNRSISSDRHSLLNSLIVNTMYNRYKIYPHEISISIDHYSYGADSIVVRYKNHSGYFYNINRLDIDMLSKKLDEFIATNYPELLL